MQWPLTAAPSVRLFTGLSQAPSNHDVTGSHRPDFQPGTGAPARGNLRLFGRSARSRPPMPSTRLVSSLLQTGAMPERKLPDLSSAQVVQLQDALLANADALLTSALAVLDLGHVALARSLAILGLEDSGKAIAIHERRVQMAHAPEGEPFRCVNLDELWASHQKKLELVHNFLVEERYWFGAEPSDPAENLGYLGTIKAWSRRHDRLKQRGFYVGLSKTGAVMTPADVADEESLADVIRHVHQIGWQLRLGEHIEGKQQDQQEQGSPSADPEMLEWLERPEARTPPLAVGLHAGGHPRETAEQRRLPVQPVRGRPEPLQEPGQARL